MAFTQNDRLAVRTPGPIRTADLQARNLALYPLSYEGMVRAERLELPEHKATGLQPAPPHHRWRARKRVTARGRTETARVTVWCAQPVHHSHHEYPRRDLNPRPAACKAAALPVELHGYDVRRARIELATAAS